MANGITVRLTDNSAAILQIMQAKKQQYLELCGQQAEANTINNINAAGRVDTGRYKNSITHTVVDDTVYIGSNLHYAKYNEFGTGKFATDGNGRPGWWVYVISDNESSHPRSTSRTIYTYQQALRIMNYLRNQGLDAHMTQGIKPTHALRDAISDHKQEYEDILDLVMHT